MRYGLNENVIAKINDAFSSIDELEQVILYGSRAKGNYKPTSDIDLTLKGEKINTTILGRISWALDDLMLPYTFDLSIFHHVTQKDLLEHIERVGIIFYEKKKDLGEWKETEIGKIPFNWELVTLNDISEVITDGAHKSPKPVVSNFLMPSVKDMTYNHFEFENCKTISEKDFNDLVHNNCSPQKGDILISKDGANCLDLIFVYNQEEKVVLLSSIAIVRLKENFNPKFYCYYLLSPQVQFLMRNNFISGSAIPRVVLKDFKNVPVPIFSKLEQDAITNILSNLDEKIDLLHLQNETLEEMGEVLFREWFVEQAKEDWEEVKVRDFCSTNTTTVKKDFPFEEIEYLDTGSLTEGKIDSTQTLLLKEAPSRAKRIVEHNNVLISTVRPNQRHYGILLNPKENLIVSTGFCVLDCHSIDPHFIYLLLTSNEMTEYLHSIAEGSTSTYPSLKPSDIEVVGFLKPPNELLDKFSNIVNGFWEKIHFNQKQMLILENLRDTLLPKLMSGEVRVKY